MIYFGLNRERINLSSHIEESELIRRLRRKDRAALEYLYDHYSSALYGMVFRILKNESLADETLQDTFMKIWNRFDHYDESRGRLFTWMINIARNHAIDRARSKEISKKQRTNSLENIVHTDEPSVEQSIEGIGVRDVLRDLPEDQKFVIEKLYWGGYTQSELADEFNIPLGTVKTRLRLAMQHLRKTLRVA